MQINTPGEDSGDILTPEPAPESGAEATVTVTVAPITPPAPAGEQAHADAAVTQVALAAGEAAANASQALQEAQQTGEQVAGVLEEVATSREALEALIRAQTEQIAALQSRLDEVAQSQAEEETPQDEPIMLSEEVEDASEQGPGDPGETTSGAESGAREAESAAEKETTPAGSAGGFKRLKLGRR